MTRRPATGTTRRALTASVGSSFLTAVLAIPLSLLVIPVTLSHLGLQEYGVWTTLSAVLALVGLSEAGVSAEVTRRVAAAAGRQDETAVRRALAEGTTLLGLLGLAVAVLGSACSGLIVSLAFPDLHGQERTRAVVVLIAVLVQLALGLALSGYFSLLNGMQRTDYTNYIGLVSRVLNLALLVVLADLHLALYSFFLSQLAGTLFTWGGAYLAVLRVRPGLHLHFARPVLSVFVPYFAISIVVLSASLSNVFDYEFDKVVLSHYRGAAASGSYQIGTTLSLAARSLALAPIGLLLAGAADLHLRDPKRLDRLERLMTQGTYAAGSVLLLGTAAFCPTFVLLWLGNGYGDATRAATVLSLALMFNLWSAPWYYYALGRRWLRESAYSALANASVNAVSSFLLTRAFGFTGALVGSTLGNGAGWLTFYLILRRRERRAWMTPAVLPLVVTGATALVAGLLLRDQRLGLLAFCAAALTWLAVTSIVLLLVGALPFRLHRRGALPRLALRA